MALLTTEALQKLAGYKNEFLAAHPNTETEEDEEGVVTDKFTDVQWINEVVKRYLLRQLFVGDRKLKQDALIKKQFDL